MEDTSRSLAIRKAIVVLTSVRLSVISTRGQVARCADTIRTGCRQKSNCVFSNSTEVEPS